MCASQVSSALGRVVEFKEMRRSRLGTFFHFTVWYEEDGTVDLEGDICVRLGEVVDVHLKEWSEPSLF